MRLDTFDLSTDRLAVPEQSQVARSGGVARVQVIRCDSPASIHVDGPSSQAIPAVPGLILENFTTLYVSNVAAGGVLVLAAYTCQPGSPQEFPYARPLAIDSLNVGPINVDVDPPGPEWSIVVTGITVVVEGTVAASDLATLAERIPGESTNTLFRSPMFDNDRLIVEFARPLVLVAGQQARLSTPTTAAGGNVYGAIRGYIIR